MIRSLPRHRHAAAPDKRIGWLARALMALVRAYRLVLSPWVGTRCRYLPTCSVYALDALQAHGALRGGGLALRRLARCHPWGGHGYDPVPEEERT